jgi:hypothetical protein
LAMWWKTSDTERNAQCREWRLGICGLPVILPGKIGCLTNWWTNETGKCQPFHSVLKDQELSVFQREAFRELLKLNRNHLQWVTGLLTGHSPESTFSHWQWPIIPLVKGAWRDESSSHILCDCEAIAYLRFRHLRHYFMEPGDYQDAPWSKILHIIWSVGLLGAEQKGTHSRSLMVVVQGIS